MASAPNFQSDRPTDEDLCTRDQNLEESWKHIYLNLPPTFKSYLSIISPTGKVKGAKRWKMIVERVQEAAAGLRSFSSLEYNHKTL